MKVADVIAEVEKDYSEWIEMLEEPHVFIMGILANKIIRLENEIVYLERRLNRVS